jgi:hypothetical protein
MELLDSDNDTRLHRLQLGFYMIFLQSGNNQSTEGAEFVWISECQKGEGCEIMNQFVFL